MRGAAVARRQHAPCGLRFSGAAQGTGRGGVPPRQAPGAVGGHRGPRP